MPSCSSKPSQRQPIYGTVFISLSIYFALSCFCVWRSSPDAGKLGQLGQFIWKLPQFYPQEARHIEHLSLLLNLTILEATQLAVPTPGCSTISHLLRVSTMSLYLSQDFLPYLWPTENKKLHVNMVVCFCSILFKMRQHSSCYYRNNRQFPLGRSTRH